MMKQHLKNFNTFLEKTINKAKELYYGDKFKHNKGDKFKHNKVILIFYEFLHKLRSVFK